MFGITTKTVRHYHKIALLPEPERSEGDYRRYTGKDLWRLRTICELRRLGLPLEQIRTVLASPDPADALRLILATQLDELETQLILLAKRKERIEQIMAQETLDVQQVNGQPELYVDKVLAQHADLIPAKLDESLLQFEREMEKMMVTFSQQDERAETISPMLAYIEAHPEAYRQAMHDYNEAWRQLATFARLDGESQQAIARLADKLVARNREIVQAFAQASKSADESSPTTAVLSGVTNEKMQAILTPAQQFFLKHLGTIAEKMRVA